MRLSLRIPIPESEYSLSRFRPDAHEIAQGPRQGYILIALTLGMVFVLGMAGLAVDIGRMYITKSEAQSFADSAAFSAALQLDGTAAGTARALTAVSSNPKKWEFQNDSFTGIQTTFST